jgi:ABC-type dipeptide/oligopeptide/nickel transport system permease subunit
MDAAIPVKPARRGFNTLLWVGALLVGLLSLAAIGAPVVAPHPPDTQYAEGLDDHGMPVPPSARFPLGTDSLGRDVLSRVIYGSRVSLLVGSVGMLTAALIGLMVGVPAGYFGKVVDTSLMRFTDVMMTLPGLLLAIALAGLMDGRVLHLHPKFIPAHFLDLKLERGVVSVFLVIGIVSWTGLARVLRGQSMQLRDREYVEAAKVLGGSHLRILWRHILPNVLPTLCVLAAMSTAGAISLEAGLSYLGVGVPPPAPSWGGMVSEGQSYLLVAPWTVWPPGLAILLAVAGFNTLGQGLQSALDPRLGKAVGVGR